MIVKTPPQKMTMITLRKVANNLNITNNNSVNNTEQYFPNNLAALKEPLEDDFGTNSRYIIRKSSWD